VLSAVLLVFSVGFAFAGTQGNDCVGDTTKVRLWENAIGDTSDGNDSLWKCFNDALLSDDSHLLPGDCKGAFIPSFTWNDCVSSFTVWIPDGQCFVSYRESSYGTAQDIIAGPRVGVRFNVVGGTNDTMSSLRWISC
jgi:hypothetical protein